MKKGILVGAGLALIALYFLYKSLGGFNEVKLDTLPLLSYEIVGKAYEGRYKDKKLEEIFHEVKGKVESGELQGTFAMVTYKEPSEHEGEISNFTGVILKKPLQEIPEGYEVRKIEAPKAVRAYLNAHPFVMPPAEKVREKMLEYAEKEGLRLQKITIDKYIGEGKLEIVIPAE